MRRDTVRGGGVTAVSFKTILETNSRGDYRVGKMSVLRNCVGTLFSEKQ